MLPKKSFLKSAAASSTPAESLLVSGSTQLLQQPPAAPFDSLRNAPTSQSLSVPPPAASIVRPAEMQPQPQQQSMQSASVAPPLSSTLPTSLNARPAERERERLKQPEATSSPIPSAAAAAKFAAPQSPDGGNSEASSDRVLEAMTLDARLKAELELRQRETRALEEEQLRRYREQLAAERVAEERRLAAEHERTIRSVVQCLI